MIYSFPDYPKDCPPKDCTEIKGKFFRLSRTSNRRDPANYLSHFEINGRHPNSCNRRALSLRQTKNQAIDLINEIGDSIGRYILVLNLDGGHGYIKNDNPSIGHCNWWIPTEVEDRTRFEEDVEGPY